MDFVTARELRAESAKIWKRLAEGEEIVVTRNGNPFALLINTPPEELEATLRAVRAERFAATVRKMQKHTAEQGLDAMTMEEVDAEITQARRERRDGDAGGR
ncbi:type II toxin-antitoxin system Phd/YefM family antitoxin [Arhodomonas sp. SL1]|uniref:type II toxin-antitoxin system Phd/YefM family antitoxin n=1 Tax=Arhodomonas sp. SL1 TaxID=3425691 RepID=UPI003F8848C1